MYFRSGWVNDAAVWEVKSKKFTVTAKVGTSKLILDIER